MRRRKQKIEVAEVKKLNAPTSWRIENKGEKTDFLGVWLERMIGWKISRTQVFPLLASRRKPLFFFSFFLFFWFNETWNFFFNFFFWAWFFLINLGDCFFFFRGSLPLFVLIRHHFLTRTFEYIYTNSFFFLSSTFPPPTKHKMRETKFLPLSHFSIISTKQTLKLSLEVIIGPSTNLFFFMPSR